MGVLPSGPASTTLAVGQNVQNVITVGGVEHCAPVTVCELCALLLRLYVYARKVAGKTHRAHACWLELLL